MADAFPRNRLPNNDDPSSSDDRCRRRWAVLKPFMAAGAVGAELGVFKGNFVDYLLATRPNKLYLVDPWFLIASKWNWVAGDKSPSVALSAILAAFKAEVDAGLVEPRIQFSWEFLSGMPDDSLDWIYIDSNHSYNSTRREITLALRKVRRRGHIFGDDYHADPTHKFHGVHKAVGEFVAAGQLKILVDGTERQFVAQRTG